MKNGIVTMKTIENEYFNSQYAMIDQDGMIWFRAKEIIEGLGLENRSQALSRLDDEDKVLAKVQTSGGIQSAVLVNEPGFYHLVMSSRKPIAKEFKRWITHEVIPAIRKSGGYIAGQEDLSNEDLHALEEQVRKLRAAVDRANTGKAKLTSYLNAEEDRTAMLIGWCVEYRRKLDAMEAELKEIRQAVKKPALSEPTTCKVGQRVKTVVKVVDPDPLMIGPDGMVIRLSELLTYDFS